MHNRICIFGEISVRAVYSMAAQVEMLWKGGQLNTRQVDLNF